MKDRKANNNSSIDLKNVRLSGNTKSLANFKNRSVKRIDFYKNVSDTPLSNRSTSSSNFVTNDAGNNRKKIQVKFKKYQENSHSKNSRH